MNGLRTQSIWRNGKMIPWAEATTHLQTHALHYGSAAFEGIRCYETAAGPAIFRLTEHLQRLARSAGAYRIPLPYDLKTLEEAAVEVVRANGLKSCYLRPIVFYGFGSLGVHPKKNPVEVAISCWSWGAYLGPEAIEQGACVMTSSWTKFHGSMLPTTAKCSGQYLNSMLAVQEAVSRGYDEAILLDRHGNLSEGSGENIFLVKDGRLVTNDAASSILMGITRDSVLKIAHDLKIPAVIRTITRDELFAADEAFFTGTAAEVTPIREADDRPIGEGKPGPITRTLQKTYLEATQGKRPEYRGWLTPAS
jgi:branched-chain amino acid aminotransferase